MKLESARGPLTYVWVTAVVAVALGVRAALDPFLGEQAVFSTLFLAVVLCAWRWGFAESVFAAVTGGLGAAYVFLPPRWSARLGPDEWLSFGLYLVASLGVCWMARDLNLRRELEEQRHETRRLRSEASEAGASQQISEARLMGLVASAMDGIITLDDQHRIVLFNHAAEFMFGVSAEEMIGRGLERLLPPSIADSHSRLIRTFGASGVTRRHMGSLGSVHGVHSDGRVFPIEASISQIEVSGTKWFTVILRDITAREESERLLRTSNAHLAAALEAGRMGTWTVNLDEGTVEWDDANCRLWGITREELGAGSLDFVFSRIHPDDQQMIAETTEAMLRDGTHVNVEYRVPQKDGSVRWHQSRGKVQRDDQGKPIHYAGVTLDITERKRAADLQLRSQKLEALGTLSGGIAHDFNNLLLAIGGNARLALEDLESDHPARESLNEIARATVRATQIVNQILSFSRPGSGERVPVQLQDVVGEALDLLRATTPRMIEIVRNLPDAPLVVQADATQMHQVLVNLVTNAIHAIDTRGRIEVTLDHVVVNGEGNSTLPDLKPGAYGRISIADDGCGMDRSTLARVFDPFFTTREARGGTGLGLSVVHGIVKSHGGTCTVYSEIGHGSVFRVYLPLVEATGSPEAPHRAETSHAAGQRILYVDDE
ncbi:MAG: PAS domain S-box protein [Fimbriimonadaceae bacterium]|nr:PAS domain S-box protein [Fimbriimonadaceae bacterium]